jgi:hypothetical protein
MKRVRKIIFNLALALCLGPLLPGTSAAQDGPQVFDVVISFDPSTETMSFSLDPVVVEQGRGDRIVFSAPDVESWRVAFAEGAPSPLRSRVVQGSGRQSRNVPVVPEAAPGTYKYNVSVTVGGRTYTVDPEIVVRPPRSG